MLKSEKELISKYCLQNAVFYAGKANPGAVLGKVLAERPELKEKIGEVRKEIAAAIARINKLSLDEQRAKLEELAPELLERKEKPQGLPELRGAVMGKVVTRFAPAPTGPLHLSHLLRAAFLSYLYAKRYRGRFILRFEDTDPKRVELRFYKWIQEDLERSGIKPDRVVVESDHMGVCYKHAEELLRSGKAYVCTCPAEAFRELKKKKQACICRDKSKEANLVDWKKMLKGGFGEGEAVVRLKTDMADPNPVLRDPPLLRIVEGKHPRVGKKYRVWPLYNFVCPIEDHLSSISHVFRAKEHEHNTAVQAKVYQAFGWEQPVTINFGMIYFSGEKLHTRDIKEMIKAGKVSGWDDPKLPTVRALLRRGFQPEAFREMAITTGLTKTDIVVGWENLEGINRKIIDPLANRVMVVTEPVRISITGAPKKKIAELPVHPDFPERGKRRIPVDIKSIWISEEDRKALDGREFRLIGLGNVILEGDRAEWTGDRIVKGMQKIQWVSRPHLQVRILKPLLEVRGLGEPGIGKFRTGSLVQMERVGFGRIDKIGKEVTIVFAHK